MNAIEMQAPNNQQHGSIYAVNGRYGIRLGKIQADRRDFKELVNKGFRPTDPVLDALTPVSFT